MFSGQSERGKGKVTLRIVVLLNQLRVKDNKALGIGYTVEDDKLHVMVRINFSKRKKRMRLGKIFCWRRCRIRQQNH